MHADTIRQYDRLTQEWIEASHPEAEGHARLLGQLAEGPIVDLGCGPGWHLPLLGPTSVGLDASASMVRAVLDAGHGPALQADLEHLPFANRSVAGAWAAKSYVHLPSTAVPMALHELHRVLDVDSRAVLHLFIGDHGDRLAGRVVPGRLFSYWSPDHLRHLIEGAGFELVDTDDLITELPIDFGRSIVWLRRVRTLADTVGPNMRVLLAGLNPSLHAADAGFGFAGPSNRFWRAALDAGLVSVDRNPRLALARDAVGMTDLVKRATPRASELGRAEYREGMTRLEWLCDWLQPGVLCVVGVTGWRAASGDAGAQLGLQPHLVGGRPVYVMPNPSGLNAHTNHDDLVAHFRTAMTLADR